MSLGNKSGFLNINVHNPDSIPSIQGLDEPIARIMSLANIPHRNPSKIGKILVVDDEKFNIDIIYSFLMLLGIVNRKELTSFAYNGEQAVEEI